jgi:nicotinate-nucleotide pyrophosphorylase (carboxylating)
MAVNPSIESLVRSALAEDIGQRDITTESTVDADARCAARLIAKQGGVLSGIEPFQLAFTVMEAGLADWQALSDGARLQRGDVVAQFSGRTRAVLTAERVAMNFVQHLSGVATLTAQYVTAVNGLACKVCSTRKTTPLMRQLEKAAVVHGGGFEHRHNLFHGILIKENHIMAAGGIRAAIERARHGAHHLMRVAVEVTNLEEFDTAVDAGADVIMLDNMDLDAMREAVRRVNGHKVVIEASGNASLDRIRAMAETGVHVISVGAITHSAPAVDMTLLITNG